MSVSSVATNPVERAPLVISTTDMGNQTSSTSSHLTSSVFNNPGPSRLIGSSSSNPNTHTKCMGVLDLTPEEKRQLLIKMRDAKNRFLTFKKNKWPKSFELATKLAEAGFYYPPGNSDRVECPFCYISLSDWSSALEPIREHFRQNPRCNFVAGYDVGNIPIYDDPVRGETRLLDFDVAGPYSSSGSASSSTPTSSSQGSTNSNSSTQSTSVSTLMNDREHLPPNNTSMIGIDLRLKSFPENWSSVCPISPIALAEAGFYYCGPHQTADRQIKNDSVRCFSCGSLLFNWEANDDPWYEHKKILMENNLKCTYLRLNYGSCSSSSAASSSDDESELTLTNRSQPMEVERIRCKVCLTNDAVVLLEDCSHLATCAPCAASLTKCPICRTEIKESRKIFT